MDALVGALGLETFPTYKEGKSRLLLDGKCYTHSGDLPLMSPLVVADLMQGMMRLGRLAKRVDVE